MNNFNLLTLKCIPRDKMIFDRVKRHELFFADVSKEGGGA